MNIENKRLFNEIYSELEILNNNISIIINNLINFQKKNLCINNTIKNKKILIKKSKKKNIKEKNIDNTENHKIESQLTELLELQNKHNNNNKNRKRKTKKKIMRPVFVLDTSSESDFSESN